MNSGTIKSLMATLQNADLDLSHLPVEICELADQVIETCDSAYLKGVDDYRHVETFLKIAAPRFIECRKLDSSNAVVKHNTEILLLLTMNLKLSLMSRPSRNKAA